MATFDQRGQRVTYQYNAAGNINISGVTDRADLADELEKLRAEVSRARESGALQQETATDAEHQMIEAIQQTRKPQPDKKSLLDHVNTAKSLIDGATTASGAVAGLANALGQAATLVHQVFP